MLFPLLLVVAVSPPLPKECEQPPPREVAPIKELANLDGAFSAGLDAVATWCFDSAGGWNAGALGKPKKPISPDAPPQGDCLKAIASCEGTFETVKNKAPLRELVANALLDFERPYRGKKYVPRRSGLKEVPSEAANCRSKSRTELFAMAQQRMDVARLSSQVLNEYANFKTWLFARGLECRNDVAAGVKADPTRSQLSIDSTVEPAPVLAPKDPDTVAALKAPMVDKWKYFSKLQAKVEADRDYTLGFLASRELRGCDCTRVNPAAVVRALEKKEGGEAGVALLTSEDPSNTRCAVCMFEVFGPWSARAQKQCTSLQTATDAEVARLEKSDDASGLPPRCFEEPKVKRAELARAAAAAAEAKAPQGRVPASFDAGGTSLALAPSGVSRPVPAPTGVQPAAIPLSATGPDAGVQLAAASGPNPNLQTVDGYTYYRPQGTGSLAGGNNAAAGNPTVANNAAVGSNPAVGTSPSVGGTRPGGGPAGTPAPAPTGTPAPVANTLTGPGTPTGPLGYVAPNTWAPIPQREDGRIYVRLFMSSSCVAEVEPGPLQARTGDLLLLPFEARALQVKSPCGGLAEVYFGREARPRVSENFGSNRPLKFEFKRQ